MSLSALAALTAVAVVLVTVVGLVLHFRQEDRAREALEDARAAGLNLPASLHPVVDYDACLGSGACIDACPEQVIGRVDGVTTLVKAGDCIGHGRCHDACPVDAISLVMGTAERGVDIPLLRAGYETNRDGVFVVGELGGMGLIRNAMRQGQQVVGPVQRALERAGPRPKGRAGEELADVLIVGAGPAGIACAVKCVEQGLSYRLVEQYALGGSVMHYPRRKLVFTEAIKLPLVGRFGKREMFKEELVAEFERVVLEAKLEVREGRRVTKVEGELGRFTVTCEAGPGEEEVLRARALVLAIGRRGTPRKLDVPGEDQPHVVYRLQDAEQYRGRRVLVVGGGDSAVEAAVALAQVAGTTVHLSYRGAGFFRVKRKNRADLEAALAAGRLTQHLETTVASIGQRTVRLKDAKGRVEVLEVDDVIVNAGGVLPTPFLEAIGVRVETKRGEKVDVGEDTAAKLAERISGHVDAVAQVSRRFAAASGQLVETATKRFGRGPSGKDKTARGPAPGPVPPPSLRAGAPPGRRDPLTTTEDLVPFDSDDKITPVASTGPELSAYAGDDRSDDVIEISGPDLPAIESSDDLDRSGA